MAEAPFIMIRSRPIWSFTAKQHLRLWYGHVRLLKNHVLGQWFAVKRDSGERLWEHPFHRANAIFEISDAVVLATETRADGPWTADFGCYGISLTSGEMLWKWYGGGLRGKMVNLLDLIPNYTNEFRPSFHGINGNEVATRRGHILDLHSGRLLRRERDISIPRKSYGPLTDAEKIYRSQSVKLTSDLLLSTREPRMKEEKRPNGSTVFSSHKSKRPFGFILKNSKDDIVWDWSPTELGLHPITNFYGWRLVEKKMMLLCGEESPIKTGGPIFGNSRATKYHLLLVDALTGRVDQQLTLSDTKLESCRIEDVDDEGFLLSYDNRDLHYYSFHLSFHP